MGGSVYFEKDRMRWAVSWRAGQGKAVKLRKYKGNFMPCTHYSTGSDGRIEPDIKRCNGYKTAYKLKNLLEARWEQYLEGRCEFRMEEFTGANWSDVIEFYKQWMREAIEPHRKPSTIHCYWSYFNNWIQPFFSQNPMRLHEIRLDTINRLKSYIKLEPKGCFNVVSALHSMMDYALRCDRIPKVPPFPKKSEYGIVKRLPQWLTKDERQRVIDQIPEEHQPIFLWLNYHFRRPGEACALHKVDYDVINNSFIIRRTLSKRTVVPSTKTYVEQLMPCDPEFTPIAKRLINKNLDSPYLFINPLARKDGKRYTLESLRNVWYAACDAAGVGRIWVYRGCKHTSCTQFIEAGGTIDELQMLTGQTRASLRHYADVTLTRRAELMERNKKRQTRQA